MPPIFAALASIPMLVLAMIFLLPLVIAIQMIVIWRRYIRCPAGKVLVITGKTKTGAPEIIRKGAVFVLPLLQDYHFLDLRPMAVEIDAGQVPVRATATIVIGTSPECLENAFSRLSGLSTDQIKEHASNIIRGQLLQSHAEAGRNRNMSELALGVQTACIMPFQHLGLELFSLVVENGEGHRNR